MRNFINYLKPVGFIIAGLFAGWLLFSSAKESSNKSNVGNTVKQADKIWTCSMHPQIRKKEKGKCPICGMDLIEAEPSDAGGESIPVLKMSEAAMKLADVKTEKAEKRFIDYEMLLYGKIAYDESRVKKITAWAAGRIERLFVDYTGVPVKKGEHLIELYSPKLFSAQEELIQSYKAFKKIPKDKNDFTYKSTVSMLNAAREKLKLLGLDSKAIGNIEQKETPSAILEINSPSSGIVIHKNAEEGIYVKTGTPIYTVADLSKLWVILKAYESDIPYLRYGQIVDISTESYGGKIFKGVVSFISPVLNDKTRTVDVRVIIDNKHGMLRPNMFVKAKVKVTLGANSKVVTQADAKNWICPMHPEIRDSENSQCTICGMDLVRLESLGYSVDQDTEKPLVVPESAVLLTGKRAIVYRKKSDSEKPAFEGIEIIAGKRAGGYYTVESGLREGDEVVVNGNFKIDSALQLQAKPSMMNPAEEKDESKPQSIAEQNKKHQHDGMKKYDLNLAEKGVLKDIVLNYFKLQKSLARDNLADAKDSSTLLLKINQNNSGNNTIQKWTDFLQIIKEKSSEMKGTETLQQAREIFQQISAEIEMAVKMFGPVEGVTINKAICPMAFDNKGASWLQP